MSEQNAAGKTVTFRILEAAIEEFAQKGYQAASTNKITKKAGTAKGLLFHYFKNKETLYLACYKHVLNWSKREFENFSKRMVDKDFFEFLKHWSLRKISLAAEKPIYANFLLSIPNVPEKIHRTVMNMIRESFSSFSGILYEKIKTVKLREGISYEDAMIFVKAIFDGLTEYYLNQYRNRTQQMLENLDEIKIQTDKILGMLKYGIIDK